MTLNFKITKSISLIILIATSSPLSAQEPVNQELRAVWITTAFNIDWPSSAHLDSYQAPILDISNLMEANSSLSEAVTNLIKSVESNQTLIDENIATCLLTGIICASQNFRHPTTKPQVLEISAYLIEKGADHQKIIQHLYKQKTISQIKILGKILEKLSFDEKNELYYASLKEQDFQECSARPKDLSYALEELKFNFRYLPNLLILWESHTSPLAIRGLIYSIKQNLIEKMLANYQGVSKGEGALFSIRETDLNSAKEQILKIL